MIKALHTLLYTSPHPCLPPNPLPRSYSTKPIRKRTLLVAGSPRVPQSLRRLVICTNRRPTHLNSKSYSKRQEMLSLGKRNAARSARSRTRLPMPGGTLQKRSSGGSLTVSSKTFTPDVCLTACLLSGHPSIDTNHSSSYTRRSLQTGCRQREGNCPNISAGIPRFKKGMRKFRTCRRLVCPGRCNCVRSLNNESGRLTRIFAERRMLVSKMLQTFMRNLMNIRKL